jgi:4-amino-4-deoxy-L-arabinose transferase-like glycosyltransferase
MDSASAASSTTPLAGAEARRVFASPRSRAFAWIALAIFVAEQVLLTWLYYAGRGKLLLGDEVRYLETARAILAGGPWHPSEIWPPAQSLFIAALGASIIGVQIAQTLLFVACGVLVARLAKKITRDSTAAVIAAALFLLNPDNAAYAHWLWPETTHLFVVLLALDLLLVHAPSRFNALVAGVLIGLALLFKSVLTAFWPLLLLAFVDWKPLRMRGSEAALFVVALAITVAPALVAGHRNTGHWSIADSSAINLLLGLEDTTRNDYVPGASANRFGEYLESGATPDARNAWAWSQVRQHLDTTPPLDIARTQLDRQYYRLFEAKTLLLTQLPGPACAGYRGAYRDAPPAAVGIVRWSSHAMHALMLAGFAFGLCLWRRWRTLAPWLLLAFVGYQLALYSALHVQARYLLPIVPVFCVFAGAAFARALQARDIADVVTATPLRLALGTALAALLLWLAFAGPFLDGYCRA